MEKEAIGGSKFDSIWPNFCFQTNFGPVFFALFQCCMGLLRLFHLFLGTFTQNCGKSLSEPILVVKKGQFDERVFGDFSKTSQPIGITLVP